MTQSRFLSAVESVANVVVGYGVALLSQLAVFPMFGIHVPLRTNIAIGAWFTLISLVRSYVLRRWFNGLKFKRPDGVIASVPPHPCRWFNGRCIDCGRAYGEPRTAGVVATPEWCAIHQHHKWCEHNGGVMGPNGWQAPSGVEGRKP